MRALYDSTYRYKGVTPFIMICLECGGELHHKKTFKTVPDSVSAIAQSWVRPLYEQYKCLPKDTQEHISAWQTNRAKAIALEAAFGTGLFEERRRAMKITLLQLHGLPWQMRSHLAMMHEHLSTYEAEVDGIKITKSVHIINEEYLKYGRNYTHYMIRGDSSIYKTHKSVVNAITNFRERRKEMIAELIG